MNIFCLNEFLGYSLKGENASSKYRQVFLAVIPYHLELDTT